MKTTIVPAQITSVEDTIAGNLNLSQLALLMSPAFIGCALYVIMPPTMELPLYKIVLLSVISIVFATLAIRIKGIILIQWLIILCRYNYRPRYYVANKNSTYLRPAAVPASKRLDPVEPAIPTSTEPPSRLSMAETIRIRTILEDPMSQLHFKANKKGSLDVHFTKID